MKAFRIAHKDVQASMQGANLFTEWYTNLDLQTYHEIRE